MVRILQTWLLGVSSKWWVLSTSAKPSKMLEAREEKEERVRGGGGGGGGADGGLRHRSFCDPRRFWSQGWNFIAVTEERHLEWSMRLNLSQYGFPDSMSHGALLFFVGVVICHVNSVCVCREEEEEERERRKKKQKKNMRKREKE